MDDIEDGHFVERTAMSDKRRKYRKKILVSLLSLYSFVCFLKSLILHIVPKKCDVICDHVLNVQIKTRCLFGGGFSETLWSE